MMTYIMFNNSKLGKRYVVKEYKDWKLMRTYPYDSLADIHLQGFTLRELKNGDRNN